MAKVSDRLAGALGDDKAGALSGLFAEEEALDGRALWRIGTWGVTAVGAVVLAVVSNQWSLGAKHDHVASIDLSRQSQQIQSLSRESQVETRRLASAIDTLNGDRDRLFSRVTSLEQGLDSVTGTVAKQSVAISARPAPAPPPSVSPPPATLMPPLTAPADVTAPPPVAMPSPSNQSVAPAPPPAAPAPDKKAEAKPEPAPGAIASLPQIASAKPAPAQATPPAVPPNAPVMAFGPSKSMMGPPDPAASKLVEPAESVAAAPAAKPAQPREPIVANAAPPDQETSSSEADEPKAAVQRTEFAVELGGANTLGGLRALWKGLLKFNNPSLADLRPIVILRESGSQRSTQMRLAAGPLPNAADAARICAALTVKGQSCETTVFDGQRLALNADEPAAAASPDKPAAKPVKRYAPKHAKKDDPAPPAPPQETSSFSLFGSKR